MFELNPHGLLDAWWQHLLMVFVAAVIGYIIGFRSGRNTIMILEDRIARLGVDIEKCKKGLVALKNTAVATPQFAATPVKVDDLKIVEGIGPKIEKLLNDDGIKTFAQLSMTSREQLKAILDKAGPRFQMHDVTTWADQAKLANEGRWEELKKWQQELDGGSLS